MRRRGAASAAEDAGNDDNDEYSKPSSSTPSSTKPISSTRTPPQTSYANGDSDHIIGYDPEEMSKVQERNKQPKLTMLEEILLLGLKDKQGYLSFWNDNISYALRGCIVIELALRGRIAMQKDSARRRYPLPDRTIEVIDDTLTGEVLLDEALKMMKSSEKMSVSSWIDLMSGETWNLMKIGYQLKQVRERLAKGLVDKGILRTEKKSFLLFDLAVHPVIDSAAKTEIQRRVRHLLTSRTIVLNDSPFLPQDLEFRTIRAMAMVCASCAANVLENALLSLGHEQRERALGVCDEFLQDYSQWPFARGSGAASGGGGGAAGVAANLGGLIAGEVGEAGGKELQLEVVAACLNVFTRLDSLL